MAGLSASCIQTTATRAPSAADQWIVESLGRWKRQADLRSVRAAEVVVRATRRCQREVEPDGVAKVMAFGEQLAPALVDQLGEVLRLGRPCEQPLTATRTGRRDDRQRCRE